MAEIDNDSALNNAAWEFHHELLAATGSIPPVIFNNIKMPLKAAIEKWLEEKGVK